MARVAHVGGLRFLSILIVTLAAFSVRADPTAAPEYRLKAAFVYQFTKFVEWPASSSATNRFLLCVLGADPFHGALEKATRGRSVAGKPLVVEHPQDLDATRACQLLFIPRGVRGKLEQAMNPARRTGTLIVSEADRTNQPGGMIILVLEKKKIRIEIDLDAAQEAGFEISSRLLKLAFVKGQAGLVGDTHHGEESR